MDITELHDEENLLVQMQDRWENYGRLDGPYLPIYGFGDL